MAGRRPIPLSIDTFVAFVVDHVSVVDCPALIVLGDAVNVSVGPLETVTVTWRVVVPPVPVAVSMYVVVCDGMTGVDPFSGCAPSPLSIETFVALVVDHESVEP